MKHPFPLALLLGSLLVGCEPATETRPPQRPTQTAPLETIALAHPTGASVLGNDVVGQLPDKQSMTDAKTASDQSRKTPATPAQARQSATADLNKDGFVTLDEITAMRDAGLDDHQILSRLRATGQLFDLTAAQEDYLINNGVNRAIVDRLRAHDTH